MKNIAIDAIVVNSDLVYKYANGILYLEKSLMLENCAMFIKTISEAIPKLNIDKLEINLDRLENIDSAGVMALNHLRKEVQILKVAISFVGGSEQVLQKINLFKPEEIRKIPQIKPVGFLEKLGSWFHNLIFFYFFEFLVLAADVFYWAAVDLFKSKSRRKGEFTNQAVLIGVNAVVIVVFMSFIIGLVLALQSSSQLRNFGANIYIVDLTVVAMMSQMGPLITAILVAGRSSSAIAAEIATMKVTAELDALKTMALNPIRFVVVPKLYASLVTMPFLIIFANLSGIIGGGVAAYFYLDISPEIFINRMGAVLKNKDLITGLIKSQAYAALIVLTGSFYGFRVERGAEGVGKVTTISVVVAISLVIIADSIIGLLFY